MTKNERKFFFYLFNDETTGYKVPSKLASLLIHYITVDMVQTEKVISVLDEFENFYLIK